MIHTFRAPRQPTIMIVLVCAAVLLLSSAVSAGCKQETRCTSESHYGNGSCILQYDWCDGISRHGLCGKGCMCCFDGNYIDCKQSAECTNNAEGSGVCINAGHCGGKTVGGICDESSGCSCCIDVCKQEETCSNALLGRGTCMYKEQNCPGKTMPHLCSGEDCVCCIEHPYEPGTVIKEPLYITLDSQSIFYSGVCRYNLASGPGFEIEAGNKRFRPGGKYSSLSYIEVIYQGNTVRVAKEKVVTINNGPPLGPSDLPQNVPGIEVTNEQDFVKITLTNGVSAKFNGVKHGKVDIPPTFMGQMTGIFGNFDGDSANDLRTKDGTIVDGDEEGYRLIGESWKIDPNCED